VESKLKNKILVVIVFVTVLLGCTHQNTLGVADIDGYKYINRASKYKDIQIELRNGKRINVTKLEISPISTILRDPVTAQRITIPTSSIDNISYRNHLSGAFEGFGLGVLIGGFVGASAGYASGENPGALQLSAESKALFAGIYYGLSGGIVGLPIGAIMGSKEIFYIEADSTIITQEP